MFRKSLFLLAIIATIAFAAPRPAVAYPSGVKIENPTAFHVWITIYSADLMSPWKIVKAECLTGRQTMTFTGLPYQDTEVKVRAEVKHGDCRSGNRSDTYDVRKDLGGFHGFLLADIYEHRGNFFIAYR